MPRSFRKPADLSDSLHHRLNMYALAASTAGVGLLSLAQPAEAGIVYTPANKGIPRCTYHLKQCFKLDLNHDGKADFYIGVDQSTYRSVSNILLWAGPAAQGNQVAGFESSASYFGQIAYALRAGQRIGPDLRFSGGLMAGRFRPKGHRSGNCVGDWNNVTKQYLGLRFHIGDHQPHYGWARLDASCARRGHVGEKGLLTGYAYETTPNKPIIAGKTKGPDVITVDPSSLGRLAQGSAGRSGK